jgi:hypothetical protein
MAPVSRAHIEQNIIKKRPQDLANYQLISLLSLCALACQYEPNPPSTWGAAVAYFSVAHTALITDTLWSDGNIDAVESLALQALYLLQSDHQEALEKSWGVLGTAIRLAEMVCPPISGSWRPLFLIWNCFTSRTARTP